MNAATMAALRVVVAMHRKHRQAPDHWRVVRARSTRGKRRARVAGQCGDPELCDICREARYLFPLPCGTHGVPAGVPCGPCLDRLDWAYLLVDAGRPMAGEVAA